MLFLKAAAEQRVESEEFDSTLIPVVDVSANCVRPNERDTTAIVEFFFSFSFQYFFLKRSGTQAVPWGEQKLVRAALAAAEAAATCSLRRRRSILQSLPAPL